MDFLFYSMKEYKCNMYVLLFFALCTVITKINFFGSYLKWRKFRVDLISRMAKIFDDSVWIYAVETIFEHFA